MFNDYLKSSIIRSLCKNFTLFSVCISFAANGLAIHNVDRDIFGTYTIVEDQVDPIDLIILLIQRLRISMKMRQMYIINIKSRRD